jgi:hypothetical protein
MKNHPFIIILSALSMVGASSAALADAQVFHSGSSAISINSGSAPLTGMVTVRLLSPSDPGYDSSLSTTACEALFSFNGIKVLAPATGSAAPSGGFTCEQLQSFSFGSGAGTYTWSIRNDSAGACFGPGTTTVMQLVQNQTGEGVFPGFFSCPQGYDIISGVALFEYSKPASPSGVVLIGKGS